MTAGIFWPRSIATDGSSAPPPDPTPTSKMVPGCNWHPAWSEQVGTPALRATILDSLVSWGCKSVRMDYAWATIENTKGTYQWTQLDTFINEANTRGLTVLLMLYWAPSWSSGSTSKNVPPSSGADFGNICGRAAARYGTKLAGVEMWNEPDISTFWTGTRPQFFQMLADAYPAAKALSPTSTFLAAAPTYIGLASGWFSEAYTHATYKPGVSYDAQAIHPYMSQANLPATAPKSNWSIRGIEDLIPLRTAKGDTSPLWATEFGWSSHANTGGEANYQLGVTEAEQAQNTTDAFSMFAGYGIAASYVYMDMNAGSTSNVQEYNYGILRGDQTEKPVVPALRRIYTAPPPGPPTAAIVGGSSFANIGGAGVTALTMTLPAGVQIGDQLFIVAICADTNAGAVITETKTGWTTVTAKADVGSMQRVMYSTTYSALTTTPSWALSAARKVAYACVAIRNGGTPQIPTPADGGGLTSTAPAVAAAVAGLGLRFYVRKDNLSTAVLLDSGLQQITGALGVATGPSAHVLAYLTNQSAAGAMAAASTTWPVTSINSTAWTVAL